jgi:hypothetical protein
MLQPAKSEKLWRRDIAIDAGWVLAVRQVVETRPQSPSVAKQVKPAFDVRIQ